MGEFLWVLGQPELDVRFSLKSSSQKKKKQKNKYLEYQS